MINVFRSGCKCVFFLYVCVRHETFIDEKDDGDEKLNEMIWCTE